MFDLCIRDLSQVKLDDIIHCMIRCFDDYFVQLPTDTSYWEERFHCARVDYTLSFGAFNGDQLTAFIINGVDFRDGKYVAFNTGTGVLPDYRGRQIVDMLYRHAIPLFSARHITHCALEVIQENARALHVYQRIGFVISKHYLCFRGILPASENRTVLYPQATFTSSSSQFITFQQHYSWDKTIRSLELAPDNLYRLYEVARRESNDVIGYFIIHCYTGALPQCEVYNDTRSEWDLLFDGVAQISQAISINNIDINRQRLIEQLQLMDLENYINQYEMEYVL